MTSRLHRRAIESALDARALVEHLPAAERAWDDLAPGIRAQALDGGSAQPSPVRVVGDGAEETGAYQVSDPTGHAATVPSPSRRAQSRVDELLRRAAAANAEAATIVQRWAIEKPLAVKELHALELQADPGCSFVARIERPDGTGNYWAPLYRTTDFAGLLPEKVRVGTWAFKFIQKHRRVPTRAETVAYCEVRRVRVKA